MTLKKIILFFSILAIIPFTNLPAQNQITVSPVVGIYLYNSENSLPVMGDKNYLLNYGFELSYRNKNIFGYNIQIDYSYLYSGIDDVFFFLKTIEGSPDPSTLYLSDVSLSLNNVDLTVNGNLGDNFFYGFGPSFSIVNRSVIFDDFVDRLASFNIGIAGLISVILPLSTNSNFWYYYISLKFRYLHGFFYDEGLRDLSNYNQNFVTSDLAVGVGYNF